MESQTRLFTGHVMGAIYLSTDCIATPTHTHTQTHKHTQTHINIHKHTCIAAALRYYPCSYWQARPAVRRSAHGIPD